jgi:predicted DNA-binding transcriptional regulator AlpA
MEPLLGVEEVSAQCGLPVATLYRLRYLGQGPRGFRLGKHLRYQGMPIGESLSTPLPPHPETRFLI